MTKFKAILDNPDLLKDSINAVSALLNEGVFKLTSSGMELSSMDSANVSMIDMKLLSTAFRTFEVEGEQEIGINISDLTNVLKRAKATDSVTLELVDNLLNIELSGNSKRTFSIPLLDIKQDAKSPTLEFPVTARLKASVIEDGISDAEIVGDAVVLEASPEYFLMRAENESRKTQLKLEKGNQDLIELNANEKVKSMFPLDYLKKIMKASKLSEETTISLGNDYPMKVDFRVIDKVNLSFILAPRIENE